MKAFKSTLAGFIFFSGRDPFLREMLRQGGRGDWGCRTATTRGVFRNARMPRILLTHTHERINSWVVDWRVTNTMIGIMSGTMRGRTRNLESVTCDNHCSSRSVSRCEDFRRKRKQVSKEARRGLDGVGKSDLPHWIRPDRVHYRYLRDAGNLKGFPSFSRKRHVCKTNSGKTFFFKKKKSFITQLSKRGR